MKKCIVVLILLLILSIAVNIIMYNKLTTAYEKIDKYLSSSYTHMTSLMIDVDDFLSRNPNMSPDDFLLFCKEKLSPTEKYSACNYAMQTSLFKWLNDQYRKFSLDTVGMYFFCFKEDGISTAKDSLTYQKSLEKFCRLWLASDIGQFFSEQNHEYAFHQDPEHFATELKPIDTYCSTFLDSYFDNGNKN